MYYIWPIHQGNSAGVKWINMKLLSFFSVFTDFIRSIMRQEKIINNEYHVTVTAI